MSGFAQKALGLATEDDDLQGQGTGEGEVLPPEEAILLNPEGTLAEDELVVAEAADSVEEVVVAQNQMEEVATELSELHEKLEGDLEEENVLSTESYHMAVAHFNHILRKYPGMAKNQSVLTASQEDLANDATRKEIHRQFALSVEESKQGFIAGAWKAVKEFFERIINFIVDSFAGRKRTIKYLEDLKAKIGSKNDKVTITGAGLTEVSLLLGTTAYFGNPNKNIAKAFENLNTLAKTVSAGSDVIPADELAKMLVEMDEKGTAWSKTKAVVGKLAGTLDLKLYLPLGISLEKRPDGSIALKTDHSTIGTINKEVQFTGSELKGILDDAIGFLNNIEDWSGKVKAIKKNFDEGLKRASEQTDTKLSTRVTMKVLRMYWFTEVTRLSHFGFRACRNLGRIAEGYLKNYEAEDKKKAA